MLTQLSYSPLFLSNRRTRTLWWRHLVSVVVQHWLADQWDDSDQWSDPAAGRNNVGNNLVPNTGRNHMGNYSVPDTGRNHVWNYLVPDTRRNPVKLSIQHCSLLCVKMLLWLECCWFLMSHATVPTFMNITVKPASLCWHWGWSLPGCMSSLTIQK